MKKILGTIVGGGLVALSLLMLIGLVGTVVEGTVAPVHALITSVVFFVMIAIGSLVLRWGWRKPADVQILLPDGQMVTLPAAMMPRTGSAQVGAVIDLGDTRGVAVAPTGPAKQALEQADAALFERDYQRAFDMYEQALRAFPETAALAYANMGVCCFFFRQYDRAIEHYELAKRHGANPWTMEENIAEARQAAVTAAR